jgi:DNA primase
MKKLIQKIRRLIRYIPVIWNSYDFDYNYALELFQMKLEDIANFMESDKAMTLNAHQRAKKIRTAIKLMQNVYDEKYAMEYHEIVEDKYGKDALNIHFEEHQSKNGYKVVVWEYQKWDNKDEICSFMHQQMNISYLKQKKAERILWEFINHNIRNWWD